MMDAAVVLGLGLLGALLWSGLVRGRLSGLRERDTAPALLAVCLLGVAVDGALLPALTGGADPESLSLRELLAVQAAANVVASVAMLLAAHLALAGGVSSLGLRRTAGPPAPLTALAAWLLLLPALALCQLVNGWLLELLDVPQVQRNLELFRSEEGARSPAVWVAMVLVIPVCEELLMRGALFGGLRRLLPPVAAMAVSALVFALLHEPAARLPVGLLGLALAWLYERTGSLAVPCLVHALQNGVTLLLSLTLEPTP